MAVIYLPTQQAVAESVEEPMMPAEMDAGGVTWETLTAKEKRKRLLDQILAMDETETTEFMQLLLRQLNKRKT